MIPYFLLPLNKTNLFICGNMAKNKKGRKKGQNNGKKNKGRTVLLGGLDEALQKADDDFAKQKADTEAAAKAATEAAAKAEKAAAAEATTTLPKISWIWWYEVKTLPQFVQWIRCQLQNLNGYVHNMTVEQISKGDTQKHVMYLKELSGKERVQEVIEARRFLHKKWGDELKYQEILLRQIIEGRREADSCEKALEEKEKRRRCNILIYMREFIKKTKIDEESLSIWNPAGFKPEEVFFCISEDPFDEPMTQNEDDMRDLLSISPEDIPAFEEKLLEICHIPDISY